MKNTDGNDKSKINGFAAETLKGKTIGIAGFGHLGSSIVSALLAHGFPKERLLISCGGRGETLERLRAAGLGRCLTDNAALMSRADIILLAARPQNLLDFRGLAVKKGAFIISFMAGISLETLQEIFSAELCRVMCSGPETIADGLGVGVSFPAESRSCAVLEAAGLKVLNISCESELNSFTVGICLPPILLNIKIDEEEKKSALFEMSKRYPVYRELTPWIERVAAAHAGDKSGASLANVSTKGGVTEAMTTALKNGAAFSEALVAGLTRNDELCAGLRRKFTASAA